ncbi:hypothetical protein ACQQ96_01150 [Lactobacillus johnsonii]|uniref:hypothetical protein n=1 Tax=Lactobacillus johnsonii TaxID=33959 RepID=UPI003D036AD6
MKVIRNIGLSIIGGMILNLLISNYYNLFMNRNYKKYINILYIKYWTYGMWGVIVLEFILFSFILVSFLKLRDLKTNFLGHYILLLCELILCELILFIVLIIKWKSAMNIWWTYLSVGCCGSFIFGILLFFQRFNSSYKNNYGNHRNDRIDKLKSNIKTDKTRLNKKKLEKTLIKSN